ncbi:hypothetical protein LPTSP4_10710 [Leptospira ryugenii]|uniref:Transmembrane protein n=1 Tax=Leptospira ryugenii TaxID=1917863 RepID=A0A2P2DY59_9LEPT|nr:transmembrane 220 family protein [Leptospira ryugenii]GBF49557.1 hypothetical protein LPTSP4_10710 [Leptospira ryugenii]
MKIFSYVVIPIFLLFAYWQLNDPDPYLWFPIYLFVAGMAAYRLKRTIPKKVLFPIVFAYSGFAIYHLIIAPYYAIEVEEYREGLGLLISAAVLLVLGKRSQD